MRFPAPAWEGGRAEVLLYGAESAPAGEGVQGPPPLAEPKRCWLAPCP